LGRRDIVVAWRGTIQGAEWVQNFNIDLDPAPLIFGPKSDVQLHNGFYSLYTSDNSSLPIADSSARKQVIIYFCVIDHQLCYIVYLDSFVTN